LNAGGRLYCGEYIIGHPTTSVGTFVMADGANTVLGIGHPQGIVLQAGGAAGGRWSGRKYSNKHTNDRPSAQGYLYLQWNVFSGHRNIIAYNNRQRRRVDI